jgi:hypothetical protein
MEHTTLADQLESECGWEKHNSQDGSFYLPAMPFDLDVAARHDSYARHHPRDQDVAFISGRMGWELKPFLIFEWDALGPGAWSSSGLHLIDNGGHRLYFCLHDEYGMWRVISAVEPRQGEGVLSDLLMYLMSKNTVKFAGLPNRTENYMPQLIRAGVIQKAYFCWMEHHGEWSKLRQCVIRLIRKRKSLSLSFSLPQHYGKHDYLDSFLTCLGKRGEGVLASRKRAILRAFFQFGYSEISS